MGTEAKAAPAKAGKALRIEKLQVFPDRVRAQVSCGRRWLSTTPELAKRALLVRPNLARHACVNGQGPTFGAVAGRTPLPHLFEHLVVDILVERSADEHATFAGTSEWLDRARGKARVEVSFTDDLEAIAAFKEAEELLNNMTAL